MTKTDKFTLEIIGSSLVSAAEETFAAFGRTSKSPVIYEVLDYACGIMDYRGRMIAQANGAPGFLGVLDIAVKDALKKFGADGFDEGDIIAMNIPHYHGTHLNDVTLVMPVFYRGKLLAFSTNKGHWSEVGGMHFGSWTSDATEIYQEGLQFPIVKLFRKGKPNEDLFDLIRSNVRTPDMTMGDMEAQAASLRVGARRILELCDKYGLNAVMEYIDWGIERAKLMIQKKLKELPHGKFTVEDTIDDDGITDTPIPVKATVEISDDKFAIDLTGSGAQVRGSVNSPYPATVSAARLIMKAVTGPQSPANDGEFDALRLVAPEGSIFNPRYPAPTSTYWEAMMFVTDIVWQALAPHMPDKLPAGHFLSVCATIVGGVDDKTKQPFAVVEPQAGGWGGGVNKDGESGLVCGGDGETFIMSNEVLEVRQPIRVEQYSLNVEDGCGHGMFRGGFGLVKDYRINNSEASFTASFGRSVYPAWGMEGGMKGTPNYFVLMRSGKEPQRMRKVAAASMKKGELIRLKTGGGGGYGDPLDRDVKRVAWDVRNEYISRQDAEKIYGFVFEQGSLEPDIAATSNLRKRLKAERKNTL
ncbi:MAG: hydantoinase B/oxoprolinase family protein [Candidatus Bathyarchaeia archaeon]|jgi:N-methylhydantoinase B